MRQKILAVDDEKDILTLLEYNLGKEGFDVVSAADGPEAIALSRSERPSLIILDIMLPNMEGTDVLKELKRAPETAGIPVIMLTAKGEEIDRVLGLELGADDYMVKPFSTRELILRVRVLLKKKESGADKVITKGPVTVDLDRFTVFADGDKLDLTTTEFKLFAVLVNARGRTLERDHLMRRISTQDNHTTTRTVDTHIRRIRAKLGVYKDCIETVRGFGYRFDEDSLY